MLLFNIPKVLYSEWLWLAIIVVVITIHYFFGKPPPPPQKPNEFFLKHKKTINLALDSILVLMLVFYWMIMSYCTTSPIRGWPKDIPPNPDMNRFALKFFLAFAVSDCSWSALMIGMLSVFQSNLTRLKRLLLLLISILPIPLIILSCLVTPHEKTEELQRIVTTGLYSLVICWVFNGPAIITGKHFFRVAWLLLRKLKLVSGEYPG